jgi:hypothetical protein
MAARRSANPLGVLWPETDAASVTLGDNGGLPRHGAAPSGPDPGGQIYDFAAAAASTQVARVQNRADSASACWRSSSWLHCMAANVAVAQDPTGNLKPAKDKSIERIDGIVALIMAIGRAMVVQEEPQPSYQMFVL